MEMEEAGFARIVGLSSYEIFIYFYRRGRGKNVTLAFL